MNKYLEKIAKIEIKPSHEGALHEQLGIAEGEPITDAVLSAARSKAEKTGNTKLLRRVVFAQNARKWKH